MHTRCTGWEGLCDLYTSNELALRSSLSQINVINNKDLQTAGYFLISLKSLCKKYKQCEGNPTYNYVCGRFDKRKNKIRIKVLSSSVTARNNCWI